MEREVRHAGGVVEWEVRYFATSLDPDRVSAWDLLGWVREHWGVENRLHHIKDRWWDMDRHRLTREGLAERFTALVNAALSVLRVAPGFGPKDPIKARADQLNWDVGRTLALFTETVE